LGLVVSMFAIAAIVWPSLRALLPVHWTGLPPAIPTRIDGYGGKVQALLVARNRAGVILIGPVSF
jgi:hypothetical protein